MQLADYVKGWERELKEGEVRENPLSELYTHFKAGTFTDKDVLEFYRQRDSPRFIEAVKLFEQGKLFRAQMQSFESWQHCDYAKEDRIAAQAFLSVENAAIQKHDGIHNFIWARVYGKRSDSGNEDKFKQEWISMNNRHNWRWNS